MSNMYEFVDKTWNPLGGECPHKCTYCSTNTLKRFPVIKEKYSGVPILYGEAYEKMRWKGKRVFVVAQNDLFAVGVSNELIQAILMRCAKYDNDYIIQTKNPERILGFLSLLPKRCTVITTIESDMFYPDVMGTCPQPMQRSISMQSISSHVNTQVTIEPIMDFNLEHFVTMIKRCNVSQVNIGADSKGNNLPEPSKEKIEALIQELEQFTTVHLKSNLKRLL